MLEISRRHRRVLLATTSSDAHTWNLVFLQLLLEENGFEVINLGSCVPDELLIDCARRERPDTIVISTVNGHASSDGVRMVQAIRNQPDIAHLPMVIGGKLGTSPASSHDSAHALANAGFDVVFTEDADPEILAERLNGLPPAHSRPALSAAGNQ